MINVSVICDFYFYGVYSDYQRIMTRHYNNTPQLQLYGQPNCYKCAGATASAFSSEQASQ